MDQCVVITADWYKVLSGLAIASILFCGAIFGFFYAWVCSVMWGFDRADPGVAIAAMQAVNASVRNAVFFPAFFLTPIVLLLTAMTAHISGRRPAAGWFAAAAFLYLTFGLLLTFIANVPMNEALAVITIPQDIEMARKIWSEYSQQWQFWNQVRAAASGLALCFAAIGLMKLRPERSEHRIVTG